MRNNCQLFLAGLLEGLSRPTSASLVVMLLTMAFLGFGFNPRLFTHIPHEYLINQPKALDVLVSQKLLNLGSEPQEKLTITLIGASSLQEAVLEEDELTQRLSARLKIPMAVNKLTSRGVIISDLLQFIDQIPINYKGIVLLCISLERYKHPQKSMARFPLTSTLYNTELRKAGISPPPKTGIFLLDNYRFFCSRSGILVKSLIFGPIQPVTYFKADVKLSELSNKKRTRISNNAKHLPQLYQKYSARNYQTLSLIISKLQENNIQVVYLHPPRNIEFLQPIYESINQGDYLQTLRTEIAEFAAISGITYWNLNDANVFRHDDFRDYSHFTNMKARIRYSEMLLDKLSHLIQTESKEKE